MSLDYIKYFTKKLVLSFNEDNMEVANKTIKRLQLLVNARKICLREGQSKEENKKYTIDELRETYLVHLTEADRFSGILIFDKKLFQSEAEAKQFCIEYNAENTEMSAPDYYTVAQYQGKVL